MKLKDYNRIDFKRVYLYCQVNRFRAYDGVLSGNVLVLRT